jgi:hypothetical protein
MNDWDRDNYLFIMKSTAENFEAWLDQATNDDIDYALKLLAMARTEIAVQSMEIMDTATNIDCTEANLIINRVKEKL